MFNTESISDVMILTPDTVLLNGKRVGAIRKFIKEYTGKGCKPFLSSNADGEITEIHVMGGDPLQREAFKQSLTKQVWN